MSFRRRKRLHPRLLCLARTRAGGFCQRRRMPGKRRCPQHGGLAGRPVGHPMHPNTAAALHRGRERWLVQMRRLKEEGKITRFPQGRKRRTSKIGQMVRRASEGIFSEREIQKSMRQRLFEELEEEKKAAAIMLAIEQLREQQRTSGPDR